MANIALPTDNIQFTYSSVDEGVLRRAFPANPPENHARRFTSQNTASQFFQELVKLDHIRNGKNSARAGDQVCLLSANSQLQTSSAA